MAAFNKVFYRCDHGSLTLSLVGLIDLGLQTNENSGNSCTAQR